MSAILYFPFHVCSHLTCYWISTFETKQAKQKQQQDIWHCFSIFADLCFCFQPFINKKGFPTPSELEEYDGLLKKKKKSPPALPILIERLLNEDLKLVAALPSVLYGIQGNG